ncbi:phage replisome organizer N-terminal domain-containing protein [Clostridium chromiireducens]|uniref:Phage replisome organiser N-terminal domain-containing protein n=1 Tax=Clostridium chromiireducens TaxID=225345 RepID=A0A1V4IDZ0_9CLOT|nr:phage replisome organizer N-terminal domain-containing protein [Clostridium chromiireducens]OPJ58156.1 hypothetical protein CLCHR_40580 [Clostridium chromiireducens]
MGEIRWVKFEVNMYDDTKLKILDNMDNRDLHQYVWTRLLVLTGKVNRGGYLYITNNMPYTVKTLAIEFNRSISEIKASIKILIKLEMIEFTEGKVFKIKNWEKHQNVEGMERYRQLNKERVANHRAKKKENNENKNEDKVISNAHINDRENNEEIYNIEDQAEKNISDSGNEEVRNNLNDSNVAEDDNRNIINNECNITCNDDNCNSNITVIEQNKKEIKKKKKIESEREIKSNYNTSLNITGGISEFEEVSHANSDTSSATSADNNATHDDLEKENASELKLTDDLENNGMSSQNAAKLLTYYENLTGRHGGLNIGILKLAIDMHGYNNVKMAMDKALEVNKVNMTYINGILKNWRREGYPKDDMEVKDNGVRGSGKNNAADKNEFTGFKPKKPRDITDEERKRSEKDLI